MEKYCNKSRGAKSSSTANKNNPKYNNNRKRRKEQLTFERPQTDRNPP